LKAATSRTATSPRFHFIGGKGGVGKTTCAAALALAGASGGLRVLVASTDPAPSLADALKLRLAAGPVEVAFDRVRSRQTLTRRRSRDPGALHAVEINASKVLRRWIAERRASLEKIALEGTWLDREDVAKLLALSLPGIDEIAALLEIARLARTGRYDSVIVDTAPTGHTLRMLAMPDTLAAIASAFDRIYDKHRLLVQAIRGGWTADREDALIHELARQAVELRDLLTDRGRTRLSWVTLPEPLAIAEATDAVEHLAQHNMRVDEIFVNRMTPHPEGRCSHCRARRAFEAMALRRLPSCRRVSVLDRSVEPRGMTVLAGIGRELAGGPKERPQVGRYRVTQTPWKAAVSPGRRVSADAVFGETTRLVMFGGKGGVGKTTCAAATAVAFADDHPEQTVLLISTDPAHSLGDVLGRAVGDAASRMKGAPRNLTVREMDASRVFQKLRANYAFAIDELCNRIVRGGGFDIGHDRSVMHALIELAPPGIDELAAVVEFTESVSTTDQLTIVDTAPTGHALRLLEMPELVHAWTKALMSILLKYQPVVGLGGLGQLLLDLSKGLGRLRELLKDQNRTRFVVVTRAAALPRLESGRLLVRLRRLGIAAPVLIVNAVGRGRCRRCAKAAAAERRELVALSGMKGSRLHTTVVTARCLPPPQTPAALAGWQRTGWRYHQDA
jgi:arsenite-transporting ATPase